MMIKSVSILFMLYAISSAAHSMPSMGKNQAFRLIEQGLRQQPLVWQGFSIPYTIERNSQHNDAAMLQALHQSGLVVRQEDMGMVEVARGRKRIAMIYRYDYPYSERVKSGREVRSGFYYGYGQLKNILSLSEVSQVNGDYYVEAYVEWYVADLQPWVQALAFQKARILRRSLESKQKPFEKRIYLQSKEGVWRFWRKEVKGISIN